MGQTLLFCSLNNNFVFSFHFESFYVDKKSPARGGETESLCLLSTALFKL
ncbi:hypothetical protein MHA_2620 [Mannheimia haemolytica PHL213]|nr:hypothetical protein MHA_2620 [Mannheimia haemolytica PHL213]